MDLVYNEISRSEVNRMLIAGIIIPVESSRTSPVVIATKENRSPRFCIEYKKLNSVVVDDRRTLTQINEINENMKGSTVFTTIDFFLS